VALKLQKFAPIDREFPIYEIVDDNGEVLLDVTRSDEGTLELGLQKNSQNRVIPLKEVLTLIEQACRLLELEGPPAKA
jgi:hypothetical protein